MHHTTSEELDLFTPLFFFPGERRRLTRLKLLTHTEDFLSGWKIVGAAPAAPTIFEPPFGNLVLYRWRGFENCWHRRNGAYDLPPKEDLNSLKNDTNF